MSLREPILHVKKIHFNPKKGRCLRYSSYIFWILPILAKYTLWMSRHLSNIHLLRRDLNFVPGQAPARDERRPPFPAVASRDERGGVAESWPLQRQSRIERKENVESREEKSLELSKQRSQNVFLHFLIRIWKLRARGSRFRTKSFQFLKAAAGILKGEWSAQEEEDEEQKRKQLKKDAVLQRKKLKKRPCLLGEGGKKKKKRELLKKDEEGGCLGAEKIGGRAQGRLRRSGFSFCRKWVVVMSWRGCWISWRWCCRSQ